MWNRVVAAASSGLGLDAAEMPQVVTTPMVTAVAVNALLFVYRRGIRHAARYWGVERWHTLASTSLSQLPSPPISPPRFPPDSIYGTPATAPEQRIPPPASTLVNAVMCRTAWKSHVRTRTAQRPSRAILRP
jgi:hypothetical protein